MKLSGVILCGGRGERFGGADKALLQLHGRPLVAHVIDRLERQVDSIVISANRNLDTYAAFGHPVVTDAMEAQGPLAGIHAALTEVTSPWLFVCPGDAPRLPRDLVGLLRSAARPDTDAVVPHDGKRRQNLFLLVRRECCENLDRYLEGGERSVHGWLATLTTQVVPFDTGDAFVNINAPEDLDALAGTSFRK